MEYVGADSETHLIMAGNLAPPIVCFSWARRSGDTFNTALVLRAEGLAELRRCLLDRNIVIIIHNAPFDLGAACEADPTLLPLVFEAYEQGRIICTITRQKLIDIALDMRKFRRFQRDGYVVVKKATYGLKDLIEMYFDEKIEKVTLKDVATSDSYRLSYALFDGIPVHRWPQDAQDYAIKDAVDHLRVYEAQEKLIIEMFGGELPNQVEQQRAAWVLQLMSMWGLRADAAAVETFISHCREQIDRMRKALADTNILKKDGSRYMAEIRRRIVESLTRMGYQVPMTDSSARFPGGQVKTDEDTLRLTDDPKLHVLADTLTFEKHLGQWGPVVLAAVERPVCCRYNVLVDNGRTSCSGGEGQEGTNIQNPPRKGDVRPCFVPRLGWVYCSTDADTIEMRANAQNCLEMVGWSKMAEALWDQYQNNGPDLHVCLAANVASISKDDAHVLHKGGDNDFKNVRQMSKHGNFAFLGGAGAKRFAGMAHGFGIALSQVYDSSQGLDDACPVFMEGVDETGKKKTVTKWVSFVAEVQRAKVIKQMFFETWPEEVEYFEIIDAMIKDGQPVHQLMSNRLRGGCTYTSLSNSLFSGRVADAMKEILWNLGIECYVGKCTELHQHGGDFCTASGRSVLFGSRPVMFLHDEPILEHPELTAAPRAERQRQVVVAGLSRWMKDVPCTSSAVLMRRWQKGAEPVFVNSVLVPSKPVKVEVGGRTKIKWVQDFGEFQNAA